MRTINAKEVRAIARNRRFSTAINTEVFVRAKAPYRAFRSTTLYAALQERLKVADVTPQGKRGAHAFRHAQAVRLLRRDTPLKVIGDVLGHRSVRSTMTYLKLDAEALRGVALEIPGVSP